MALQGDQGDQLRQGAKLHPCLKISPSSLVLDWIPPPQLTVHLVHSDQAPEEGLGLVSEDILSGVAVDNVSTIQGRICRDKTNRNMKVYNLLLESKNS